MNLMNLLSETFVQRAMSALVCPGGGAALLFKKLLKLEKQSLLKSRIKSFEFTDVQMKHLRNLRNQDI